MVMGKLATRQMVRKIKRSVFPTFTVPLDSSIHCQAQELFKQHKQQSNPQRAKQIYLNTLAVSAVNSYLNYTGIETDLKASDRYDPDPELQDLYNLTDLQVTGIGKLDCLPVWSGAEVIQIPSDTLLSSEIGYIAVQLDGALQEATLLGFLKTIEEARVVETEELSIKELPINHLKSLAGILQYLTRRQRIINSCKSLTNDLSDAIALARREIHWWEGIEPRNEYYSETRKERTRYKINNIIDPAIQRILGVEITCDDSCEIYFEGLMINVHPYDEYLWTITIEEGKKYSRNVHKREKYHSTESKSWSLWTKLKPDDVQKHLLYTLDNIRTGEIFD